VERELLDRLSYSLNVSETEYNDWVGVLRNIASKDDERLRVHGSYLRKARMHLLRDARCDFESRKRLSQAYE
jgi:hypothetical protein